MAAKRKSNKPEMSRTEAEFHEAAAGAQAREEAVREGLDDKLAEDAIMAVTSPSRSVRGKLLRHPSRGTILCKYRIQERFIDWAKSQGLDPESIRYDDILSIIFLLVFWDPHYFDAAIDGSESMDDLVARLEAINDDPDWTADLLVLTDHMIDCLKVLDQTAGSTPPSEEAKKKS